MPENQDTTPSGRKLAASLANAARLYYESDIWLMEELGAGIDAPWNNRVVSTPDRRVSGLVKPCLAVALRQDAPGWTLDTDVDLNDVFSGMIVTPPGGRPITYRIETTLDRATVFDQSGRNLGTALLTHSGNDALELLATVLAHEISERGGAENLA